MNATQAPPTVDVDDLTSWPLAVRERVQAWVRTYRGTTLYTGDIELDKEDEDEFRALLAGYRLRAYHRTRLMDHEFDMILRDGLRLSTGALLAARLDSAAREGAISPALRARLEAVNYFAAGKRDGVRGDAIYLFLSRRTLDHSVNGVAYLLSMWGGEVVFKMSMEVRPELELLGKPAVVVTDVDLSASWRVHRTSPSLHKVFVGAALGFDDYTADVRYCAHVPPEHVAGIWTPGDAEYDRHTGLPVSASLARLDRSGRPLRHHRLCS